MYLALYFDSLKRLLNFFLGRLFPLPTLSHHPIHMMSQLVDAQVN
jgi:hypothetical protein